MKHLHTTLRSYALDYEWFQEKLGVIDFFGAAMSSAKILVFYLQKKETVEVKVGDK